MLLLHILHLLVQAYGSQLHLHLHGASAEDVAAIVRRQHEP